MDSVTGVFETSPKRTIIDWGLHIWANQCSSSGCHSHVWTSPPGPRHVWRNPTSVLFHYHPRFFITYQHPIKSTVCDHDILLNHQVILLYQRSNTIASILFLCLVWNDQPKGIGNKWGLLVPTALIREDDDDSGNDDDDNEIRKSTRASLF